jgi:hypothetical protein
MATKDHTGAKIQQMGMELRGVPKLSSIIRMENLSSLRHTVTILLRRLDMTQNVATPFLESQVWLEELKFQESIQLCLL